MKTRHIYILLSILCGTAQLWAQSKRVSESPWYVGAKGGIIFGESSFASRGADETRAGYNVGVLAGYQINSIFSTELSLTTGHMSLGARACCVDKYWLDADGIRYFTPLTDQTGYSYHDIYSSVALQQLGLHVNINLFSLINRSFESRWYVLVSPALYCVGSKATIKTSSDRETLFANDYHLGFGVGADVALGYAITKSLDVRLGAGINVLTGHNLDGISKSVHRGNFLLNSNLALTWRFGKGRSNTKSPAVPLAVIGQSQRQRTEVETQPVENSQTDTVEIETKLQENGETSLVKVVSDSMQISLPSVYFAFDSYKINRRQLPAMDRILSAMREYPQMKITVTGWCDPLGSKAVNNSISLKRAKAVGRWLADRGIAAGRIKYSGMGVDKTQPNYKKARRADVTTDEKE